MPFQFFFSHANLDWDTDKYLRTFFTDLKAEVGRGYPPADVAFRDKQNISLAEEWQPAMAAGLNTSRVLVCVITDNWFKSEFCGKEVEVFLRRRALFPQDTPRKQMSCIVPVFWEKKGQVPTVLEPFQWTHEGLPASYTQEGLRYLKKMEKQQYIKSVHVIAEKIRELAGGPALPSLSPFPPLSQIPSALHPAPAQAPTASGPAASPASAAPVSPSGAKGPNSVKFIFVAATPQEMEALWNNNKARVEAVYGQRGSRDWKPFVPDESRPIGLLAQDAASAHELYFDYLPLPERLGDIKKVIQQADRDNELVVIIVDVWSTLIERYERELRECDTLLLPNFSVVVPWNDGTPETQSRRQELLDMLQKVFKAKKSVAGSVYYNTGIQSPVTLKRQLTKILRDLKANVLEQGHVKKRIEARSPSIPILSGPSGEQQG